MEWPQQAVIHFYLSHRILAALNYPKLFSSLILVDPIISMNDLFVEENYDHIYKLAFGALARRSTWPSR